MRKWLAKSTKQPPAPALHIVVPVTKGGRTVLIALDEVSAVRIDDATQVVEHRITNFSGGTMAHVVRFVGGGELRFTKNSYGQLVELATERVRASICPERVLSVRACIGAPEVRLGTRRRAKSPAPAAEGALNGSPGRLQQPAFSQRR
jgi:hypothetical protein